ncbi:hypothetical protein [Paraflavitalea sp. CAU 1676]|uniref:hypothetical protein n=1 Tax=Paraflavitalea sp. CAU 1676 TaxID=3032598 RepID=UPI0023DBB5B4|nr:hypothetical protein [Paraflavitalea sp. CAU 1676]MDF2189233.1 hypothetical protein [Paraflavitalea sp. CAU 1676]
MNHSDEYLERIRQTEIDSLNLISKFFSEMTIETTSEIARPNDVVGDITEKTFRPSSYSKYVVLALALGLLILVVRETLFSDKANGIGLLFGYTFSGILIVTSIWQYSLDKTRNYVIHVDRRGILIDDRLFQWQNIYETAILTNPGAKVNSQYLIVVDKTMVSYDKFDLANFSSLNFEGFSLTLCRYIEYFKRVSRAEQPERHTR